MKLSTRKLQMVMAEKCISLTELCQKAEISTVTLRDVRFGRQNPRPSTIGKIAKALNVSVQDIIEDMD
ncbi:DNA-binding transcriptional regulator, XRE family [Pseudobutyrivibrio sp. JW11]|uniref:helix-turn-helix domain-containing protein n=1 Tax=Pseudobutyrivibrio sp. JW11 TaxID=1855302 RepID=UPI0008F332A3|nr:helix-turn-helix transcriptional regulator [Pseudobutyrivibrio sp. JW11]SFO26995.1 DNA-binding transcriptional regulator, XRE family [Pseudobutyrivibrio sp. JW11]